MPVDTCYRLGCRISPRQQYYSWRSESGTCTIHRLAGSDGNNFFTQQNVLVDKRGTPRICDFGISKIINCKGFTTSSVGTALYMAPELFCVADSTAEEYSPSTTKSSDVYSFALLALEVRADQPIRCYDFRSSFRF